MRLARRKNGLVIILALSALSSLTAAASLRERAARAYREQRYAEAVALLRQAVAQEPEAIELWNNLGCALYQQGDYQQAAESYTRALTLASHDRVRAGLLYNLGNARLRAGLIDQAIEDYKASLRLLPGHEAAKFNLEIALRRRQQNNRASGAPMPLNRQPPASRSSPQTHPPSSLGAQAQMTREQAERILDALRQYERIDRQRRTSSGRPPSKRDW